MLKFITLLLTVAMLPLYAQKNLKQGDKAYKRQDYYTAQKYYEQALRTEDNKRLKPRRQADLYYRMAESCRYIYLFAQAETYYQKVAEHPEKMAYPDVDFYYAYTLKHNGKYALAAEKFKSFLAITANDDNPRYTRLRPKAEQEIKACALAIAMVRTPEKDVKIASLGKNVNTQYSDFAPHTVGNDLYYSSLRFERQWSGRRAANEPKEKYLVGKLFFSRDKGTRAATPNSSLNIKFQSVGNSTISPDEKWIYYTICTAVSATEMRCELHRSRRKSSYWSKPQKLPVGSINVEGFTSTHPNIGFDSVLMKPVLFYVSNRANGQGDMDIWCATIEHTDSMWFGTPQNLGSVVNTEDADATPFFHTPTQTLYFSSKWHEGLGGFDLFKSKRTRDGWTTPQNLGVPFNSAANDLYLWINKDDTTAYFASNRSGSQTLIGESCCNDIYTIRMPSDFINSTPDWIVADTVKRADTPQIIVAKLDTQVIIKDVVQIEPTAEPTPAPEVVTNPTQSVVAENMVLIPSEQPEPANPQPTNPPTVATTAQTTVQTINQMLPISLYFHNDEPDSNTTRTYTKIPYAESYEFYMSLRDIYKREYSRPCKTVEQQNLARQRMDEFFEQQLTGEYKRLNACLDAMASFLAKNPAATMEIQVRGFTSPRAATSYNKNLAKRRISSFRNYAEVYNEGVLREYIDANRLLIKEMPMGETKAGNVSDEFGNPLSIYSVEAARERRIEVQLILAK